jgi:hypothetical protein
MRRAGVILVCCVLLAGCTADRPRTTRSTAAPVASASPAATPAASATCPATADIRANAGGVTERQGVGQGATLWALFFAQKAVAGQEIKIAWRMTGSGDLTIAAAGPRGAAAKPSWGPEAHGGSSFQRPGDEWGTGWVFPTAGCWTVNATRAQGTAKLVIRVA